MASPVPDARHHHDVWQVQTGADEPWMHTHPSSLPASVVIVQTSFPVPAPLQGVVHAALSPVPAGHAAGDATG
jgi:hypothetical protein